MNSTSFESRHSQYDVSAMATLAQQPETPGTPQPQGLNLTSSPKFSFKAPTAEDFDKGSRAITEEPGSNPLLCLFANLWHKLSSR